jgi:hypothetical protein
MIQLSTEKTIYSFCSTCRARMVVSYSDGDVLSMKCPDQHESFLNYKTFEGFKKYAIQLFSPKVGMGVKE